MRNKKILILLFLLFFLSGCGLLGPSKVIKQRTSSEEILVKSQTPLPVDLLILLDQSGSMSGAMGQAATDPNGLRVDAVKYFINNFSTKSDQKSPNRIGIINFGSNVPRQYLIPLTEVYFQNQQAINNLTSKIKPLNLGGTNFISALQNAAEEFQRNNSFSSNRSSAVVIFTDGEPYDSRKLSLSTYFKEIKSYIDKNFPKSCRIFIVGIDDKRNTWSKTLPYWKQILPEKRILKINKMSDLQEIFNNIIRQIFQIPNVAPDVVGTTEKPFTVPPYIDSLELHAFFKGKKGKLLVYNPNNKVVDFQKTTGCYEIDKGTYTIFIISQPPPGKWKYKMVEGTGTVEIYKNFIPVTVGLITPKSPYPAFKKSKVLVEFVKKNGAPVKSDPRYPLRIAVSIKDESGNIIFNDILNKAAQVGIYRSNKIFYPEKAGIYSLTFGVAGGTEYSYSYTKKIDVKGIPYLSPVYPTFDSTTPISKQVNLKVKLQKMGKDIDPAQEFSTNPLLLVRAQIESPSELEKQQGTIAKVVWLDPDKNRSNLFSCLIPIDNVQKGNYTILVALKGVLKSSGEIYSNVLSINFAMAPTTWQNAKRKTFLIIIVLFILWLLQWFLFIWLRKSSIRDIVTVLFYAKKEDREITLQQKTLSRGRFVLFTAASANLFGIPSNERKNMGIGNKIVLVYGRGINVYYAVFNNRFEYFVFPLIGSYFKKETLTKGLDKNIFGNVFINVS